ncbi:hypothetical protein BJD78_gp38 [Arthrobacter phage KellEzio]|uniref:Uncharacterized protein n=2 Tax=Kelleziovirus TaxID=1982236 RepID=A0A140G6C3_9CAUD|nr:hypothetical protein BJD78_gp38 [Arthrobacter phage KellEzio]AMM44208.1 hypothetical protein KELLEZIO_38 [Arthrobacter phage KellEzio]QGJ96477.1 hypothetical protein SEA_BEATUSCOMEDENTI_38 [Arthrobacter phage BeatusComedenti]
MADATAVTDWMEIGKTVIPYITSGAGGLGLYFYWRKIDADNRKRDKEDIVDLRTENRELRKENGRYIDLLLENGIKVKEDDIDEQPSGTP